MCCVGERIFCEHGGRGRKESICQRTMDILLQREDEYFVQSEGAKDGSKFKKLLKELEYQKIVDLLTAGKGKWKGTKKTLIYIHFHRRFN